MKTATVFAAALMSACIQANAVCANEWGPTDCQIVQEFFEEMRERDAEFPIFTFSSSSVIVRSGSIAVGATGNQRLADELQWISEWLSEFGETYGRNDHVAPGSLFQTLLAERCPRR